MDYYYEVQQRSMSGWRTMAAFKKRKNAKKHEEEFNIGAEVNPTRIVKKEFFDDIYE